MTDKKKPVFIKNTYIDIMDTTMLSLDKFQVNLWTNVDQKFLFNNTQNYTVPDSIKKISIQNINTIEHYQKFEEFFESSYNYILKTDLARLLILREKGGIYIDSDFYILRDFEPILSQYSEIYTLERNNKPLIANNFFASIPYGPIINAIYDQVWYNLNLYQHRPKELNTTRDEPMNSGSKTMMHIGPIAYTEAIYKKL